MSVLELCLSKELSRMNAIYRKSVKILPTCFGLPDAVSGVEGIRYESMFPKDGVCGRCALVIWHILGRRDFLSDRSSEPLGMMLILWLCFWMAAWTSTLDKSCNYSGLHLFSRKGWVRKGLGCFAAINSMSYVPLASMRVCGRGLGSGGKVNFYISFPVLQRTTQSLLPKITRNGKAWICSA